MYGNHIFGGLTGGLLHQQSNEQQLYWEQQHINRPNNHDEYQSPSTQPFLLTSSDENLQQNLNLLGSGPSTRHNTTLLNTAYPSNQGLDKLMLYQHQQQQHQQQQQQFQVDEEITPADVPANPTMNLTDSQTNMAEQLESFYRVHVSSNEQQCAAAEKKKDRNQMPKYKAMKVVEHRMVLTAGTVPAKSSPTQLSLAAAASSPKNNTPVVASKQTSSNTSLAGMIGCGNRQLNNQKNLLQSTGRHQQRQQRFKSQPSAAKRYGQQKSNKRSEQKSNNFLVLNAVTTHRVPSINYQNQQASSTLASRTNSTQYFMDNLKQRLSSQVGASSGHQVTPEDHQFMLGTFENNIPERHAQETLHNHHNHNNKITGSKPIIPVYKTLDDANYKQQIVIKKQSLPQESITANHQNRKEYHQNQGQNDKKHRISNKTANNTTLSPRRLRLGASPRMRRGLQNSNKNNKRINIEIHIEQIGSGSKNNGRSLQQSRQMQKPTGVGDFLSKQEMIVASEQYNNHHHHNSKPYQSNKQQSPLCQNVAFSIGQPQILSQQSPSRRRQQWQQEKQNPSTIAHSQSQSPNRKRSQARRYSNLQQSAAELMMEENEGVQGFSFKSTLKREGGTVAAVAASFNNPFEGIININSSGAYCTATDDGDLNATGQFSRKMTAPSRMSNDSAMANYHHSYNKSRTTQQKGEDNNDMVKKSNDKNKTSAFLCVERKDQGVIISQEFKVTPASTSSAIGATVRLQKGEETSPNANAICQQTTSKNHTRIRNNKAQNINYKHRNRGKYNHIVDSKDFTAENNKSVQADSGQEKTSGCFQHHHHNQAASLLPQHQERISVQQLSSSAAAGVSLHCNQRRNKNSLGSLSKKVTATATAQGQVCSSTLPPGIASTNFSNHPAATAGGGTHIKILLTKKAVHQPLSSHNGGEISSQNQLHHQQYHQPNQDLISVDVPQPPPSHSRPAAAAGTIQSSSQCICCNLCCNQQEQQPFANFDTQEDVPLQQNEKEQKSVELLPIVRQELHLQNPQSSNKNNKPIKLRNYQGDNSSILLNKTENNTTTSNNANQQNQHWQTSTSNKTVEIVQKNTNTKQKDHRNKQHHDQQQQFQQEEGSKRTMNNLNLFNFCSPLKQAQSARRLQHQNSSSIGGDNNSRRISFAQQKKKLRAKTVSGTAINLLNNNNSKQQNNANTKLNARTKVVQNGPEFFCFITPKSTVYQSLPINLLKYQQDRLEFASNGTRQLLDENQDGSTISCIAAPTAGLNQQSHKKLQLIKMVGANESNSSNKQVIEQETTAFLMGSDVRRQKQVLSARNQPPLTSNFVVETSSDHQPISLMPVSKRGSAILDNMHGYGGPSTLMQVGPSPDLNDDTQSTNFKQCWWPPQQKSSETNHHAMLTVPDIKRGSFTATVDSAARVNQRKLIQDNDQSEVIGAKKDGQLTTQPNQNQSAKYKGVTESGAQKSFNKTHRPQSSAVNKIRMTLMNSQQRNHPIIKLTDVLTSPSLRPKENGSSQGTTTHKRRPQSSVVRYNNKVSSLKRGKMTTTTVRDTKAIRATSEAKREAAPNESSAPVVDDADPPSKPSLTTPKTANPLRNQLLSNKQQPLTVATAAANRVGFPYQTTTANINNTKTASVVLKASILGLQPRKVADRSATAEKQHHRARVTSSSLKPPSMNEFVDQGIGGNDSLLIRVRKQIEDLKGRTAAVTSDGQAVAAKKAID